MKYSKTIFFTALPLLLVTLTLKSCIINHPKPEACEVIEITVTDILEGSSFDIVFKDSGTDRFYINRGLEQGLSIEVLREKVLNKKVTLHLPKLFFGTSEHIAQLAVEGDVIFTEFD